MRGKKQGFSDIRKSGLRAYGSSFQLPSENGVRGKYINHGARRHGFGRTNFEEGFAEGRQRRVREYWKGVPYLGAIFGCHVKMKYGR